ncbi:unnamed protein product [Prorocentrum cordatum]|uniref:Uncharacterized protein n=1 Tax=Prorocentrum cordatum TaxID=2364126 RepID=A0ABN9P6F7_9DINO|nr:unnamed protein product [Polarella glacialis]
MVAFCVDSLSLPCKARDGDGDTPLLVAVYEGHASVVEWLLDHGSTADESNNDGVSVVLAAEACGHADVRRLLDRRLAGGLEKLWLDEVARRPQLILNFLERGAPAAGEPGAPCASAGSGDVDMAR